MPAVSWFGHQSTEEKVLKMVVIDVRQGKRRFGPGCTRANRVWRIRDDEGSEIALGRLKMEELIVHASVAAMHGVLDDVGLMNMAEYLSERHPQPVLVDGT